MAFIIRVHEWLNLFLKGVDVGFPPAIIAVSSTDEIVSVKTCTGCRVRWLAYSRYSLVMLQRRSQFISKSGALGGFKAEAEEHHLGTVRRRQDPECH